MTNMNALIVMMCMTGLSPLAFAQSATPPRIAASEAKKHAGETVTVCGKVVDTKIPKYGLAGRGKPVTFDLDQPEPNPTRMARFMTQAGMLLKGGAEGGLFIMIGRKRH